MKQQKKQLHKLSSYLGKNKKGIMGTYTALAILTTFPQAVYASAATEFLGTAIEFLAWGVGAIGGFLILFGLVTFGMAFSQDNAAEKTKGILGIVGGAIVIAVGVLIGTVGVNLIGTPPGM